jgi:hypothetical protein
MGAIIGLGTLYISGAPEFIPGFQSGSCYLFGILVLLLVIIGAIFNYLDFVGWGIAKKSLKKPKG